MLTRRHRLSEGFEFTDGLRRFALTHSGANGLQPDHGASLLRTRLRGDWYLRQSLAAWYRRSAITPAFVDDARMIEAVLREVGLGRLRVHELERTAMPIYTHSYARADAPASEPEAPTLNAFDPSLDEPSVPDQRSVEYLAIGDFNFSTDRAVMLPGPSSEAELAGDLADGIALIAGVLGHLRRVDEQRQVMAAGHTDAVGTFAHNLELSEQRALSVKLACDGDAEGFAHHALAHGEIADGQEVLRWIDRRFGWGCDPGAVDNEDGPKTSGARTRFRARFAAEFSEAAGSGPEFERADWLAFFRLYEQDLAARLGVTPGGLPSLRSRLAWTDPAVLGCGEHWPEDTISRSPVNRADRRVELLCFAPDDVPAGAGDPPGGSVYGDPKYRWIAIRPGPGPHPLGGPCFELALRADIFGPNIEDSALRLHGGPYELRHEAADASQRGDFLVFHFHGIAIGTAYAATLERGGDEPISLFEGASLDSYIAGIDDLEVQPDPVVIHIAHKPESRVSGGPFEDIEPPEEY